MSKFKKTIRSESYWILKGQGQIFNMLKEELKDRGDNARLAEKIGSTPGYISQIMNGDSEINPTWKKIVKLCLSLGKVPILEIKNIDKYIEDQNFRVNYNSFIDNQLLPNLNFNILNENHSRGYNLAENDLVTLKRDAETMILINEEQYEISV